MDSKELLMEQIRWYMERIDFTERQAQTLLATLNRMLIESGGETDCTAHNQKTREKVIL